MGAILTPVVVVGHLVEPLESTRPGCAAPPREAGLGVEPRVLVERHLVLFDGLDGVVGLAGVGRSHSEKLSSRGRRRTWPATIHDPGAMRSNHSSVGLVAVAVVASGDGDAASPPRSARALLGRRTVLDPAEGEQLQDDEHEPRRRRRPGRASASCGGCRRAGGGVTPGRWLASVGYRGKVEQRLRPGRCGRRGGRCPTSPSSSACPARRSRCGCGTSSWRWGLGGCGSRRRGRTACETPAWPRSTRWNALGAPAARPVVVGPGVPCCRRRLVRRRGGEARRPGLLRQQRPGR